MRNKTIGKILLSMLVVLFIFLFAPQLIPYGFYTVSVFYGLFGSFFMAIYAAIRLIRIK